MTKPIIFFSHSSKDRDCLVKLKEFFVSKTSNTIDVFLSSDGQSIPLGKDWIHKIQDSLNNSKIMIIFLTPNSINSQWVYFESGYTYSRNIRVIPVGFLGIDLNHIKPPLSILQGFNINTEEGLNNLIGIINEEFSFNHELSFTKNEFNQVIELSPMLKSEMNNSLVSVESIEVYFTKDEDYTKDNEVVFNEIKEFMKLEKYEFQLDKSSIITHGLIVNNHDNKDEKLIRISMDPNLLNYNQVKLERIIGIIRNENLMNLQFYLLFDYNIDFVTDKLKLSTKLYNTTIRYDERNGYSYKEIWFFIFSRRYIDNTSQTHIQIINKSNSLVLEDLYTLVNTLFEKEILFVSE
ncbi:MAG: toll/interleukin-1 receptor domain-containing protein [Ignavibacteria bacterium]|nr:toll/interleukin-1 receptor domain-containing protein [Ignavibacteria bacterium]